jgi:TolB-like protein
MNLAGMRKWAPPLVIAVAAGLMFLAWNHFPPSAGTGPGNQRGPGKAERAQIYLGPANSIAVLPFTGDAAGQQPAFWSYGFSRELHRLITRTPGLQVTSQNSSFFFAGQSVPLSIIAERLKTRYLLSGEVLVAGGRIQVKANLFDARKKAESWSRSFAGSMDDAFLIQDEILADTLQAIAPRRQDEMPHSRPVSTEAWVAFLEGLYFRQQKTESGFKAAEQAFQAAIGVDPTYAMARVGLAGLWLEMSDIEQGDVSRVESARRALDTALQSEADLPEALGLLSYIQRNLDWNWTAALETATQALQLSPGDPELMSTAGLAMFSLGQFEKAGDLLAASAGQDPLNLLRRLQLGLLQEFAGQADEALGSYRQILGLNPDFPGVRAFRARVKIIQDKPESSLKESEQEVDPFWKRYSLILAYTALGQDDKAQPLLNQMIAEDGGRSAYQVAEILAFRGDIDSAFEWLQRAWDQKDGGLSEMIGNHFFNNLHTDPRWAGFLNRLGLPSGGTDPANARSPD